MAIFISLIMLTCASFMDAQNKAKKIENSFEGNLSPLRGSLILFKNGRLRPSWLFSAEYSDLMTGARFDINISIFGKVIRQPPKNKKIQ